MCVAPSALRTPISRVRSVTDASMTFMIPMPPTTSDTVAMPASSRPNVCVVSFSTSRKSDWFQMEKSSGRPTPSLCDRRRASLISPIAVSIASSDSASVQMSLIRSVRQSLRGGIVFQAFRIRCGKTAVSLSAFTLPDGKLEQYQIAAP